LFNLLNSQPQFGDGTLTSLSVVSTYSLSSIST
jgi:hypothetical protein